MFTIKKDFDPLSMSLFFNKQTNTFDSRDSTAFT